MRDVICEPPPSMFPELLQCHWWRSRPRPRSNHRLQHAENTAELSRSVQQNYPQSENTAVLQWRLVTTKWLVFCAGWFIFGFGDIASEMEWLEGEGPLSSLIQNEMNIFGFDMDLVFIFAEESIQKQVKSKKADLLCLNRIETDEHLYYNHDFKLVLVQLSLCWGKTILYVHIPVLPSHHLKLTRSKLYHWAHIWLLLPTYTMRTHSMFVFIFVACHIPSQTFPYQEQGAKLHPMSEFNNC